MKTTKNPKTNVLRNYLETSCNLPAPVVLLLFGLWIFSLHRLCTCTEKKTTTEQAVLDCCSFVSLPWLKYRFSKGVEKFWVVLVRVFLGREVVGFFWFDLCGGFFVRKNWAFFLLFFTEILNWSFGLTNFLKRVIDGREEMDNRRTP